MELNNQTINKIGILILVVVAVIAVAKMVFPLIPTPPKDWESQPTYEDTMREELASFEVEIKENVFTLCEDNPRSQTCKDAIERCFKNQNCQNMVTTYQLRVKGTPELDDMAFINASKEFIEIERAQLGLPPLKR